MIEVVVGVALMGTLATSAIMAGSSHLRQLHAAQLKHRSTETIDRFLTQWSRHNFKLEQASQAASEAGVLLHDQFGFSANAPRFTGEATASPNITLALELGNEIPALRGRVCYVIARGRSGAAAATAEIVIGDE